MPRRVGNSTRTRPRRSSTALARIGPVDIDARIFLIRGQRVLLDSDLAVLYGVTTGNLNKAVNRNLERFPQDFMFRLTAAEFGQESRPTDARNLISQTGRSSWGGRRKLPYAFTEQGVAMLSSVLRSKRAVAVNIEIMRAFVRLRQLLHANHDLARRLDDLDRKFTRRTDEHAAHIARIYELLDALMNPPDPPRNGRIGFRIAEPEGT